MKESEYLNHLFSLQDLSNLMPSYKIFEAKCFQTQINQNDNFTFGLEWFSIKIKKSKQNSKRILYYSILCYIYQMISVQQRQSHISNIISFIIQKLPIIVPYKVYSQLCKQPQSQIILTTNQQKSCLIKFLHNMNKKSLKPKQIFNELLNLPQIDMVFMSLMQMIIRKNQDVNARWMKIITNCFGIQAQIVRDGFLIGKICQVQIIKSNNLDYDQFMVRKLDYNIQNNKKSILIRKNSTDSIGSIQLQNQQQTSYSNDINKLTNNQIQEKFNFTLQENNYKEIKAKQNKKIISNNKLSFLLKNNNVNSKNSQPLKKLCSKRVKSDCSENDIKFLKGHAFNESKQNRIKQWKNSNFISDKFGKIKACQSEKNLQLSYKKTQSSQCQGQMFSSCTNNKTSADTTITTDENRYLRIPSFKQRIKSIKI